MVRAPTQAVCIETAHGLDVGPEVAGYGFVDHLERRFELQQDRVGFEAVVERPDLEADAADQAEEVRAVARIQRNDFRETDLCSHAGELRIVHQTARGIEYRRRQDERIVLFPAIPAAVGTPPRGARRARRLPFDLAHLGIRVDLAEEAVVVYHQVELGKPAVVDVVELFDRDGLGEDEVRAADRGGRDGVAVGVRGV